jgi:hypothetical protein
MKRHLLVLIALTGMLACSSPQSAHAAGGHGCRGARLSGHHGGRGHGGGHGHSVGFGKSCGFGSGFGFGFGGGSFGCGWDIAELYRQLYNNLPYFALHPPVYYSYPVPRTYGYSPFAYPPGVMTPDVAAIQPLEIINPHVPSPQEKPVSVEKDQTASAGLQPQPLVILNPYVSPNRAVASSKR